MVAWPAHLEGHGAYNRGRKGYVPGLGQGLLTWREAACKQQDEERRGSCTVHGVPNFAGE